MYNVVIVEDDQMQAEAIEEMVKKSFCAGILSVTRFSSLEEFEELLKGSWSMRDIDILLMDICFGSEQPVGIDFVKKHFPNGCGTQVIYITGHIEFCTKVYRTEHVYFLTKPVNLAEFNEALGKAIVNLRQSANRPIGIQMGGRVVLVAPQKISYLESDRRKVRIHVGSEVLETYASLGQMMEKLPDTFLHCHKSFLVNMDHVAELQSDCLTLLSGENIPVSQKRRKAVKESFLSYLRTRL